jgi:tyrosine-protein phosphatase YwqE
MHKNTISGLTFNQLKDMGCEFQLNLLSLIGMYGELSKKIAIHLLNKQ